MRPNSAESCECVCVCMCWVCQGTVCARQEKAGATANRLWTLPPSLLQPLTPPRAPTPTHLELWEDLCQEVKESNDSIHEGDGDWEVLGGQPSQPWVQETTHRGGRGSSIWGSSRGKRVSIRMENRQNCEAVVTGCHAQLPPT
jgi:hypothetical protein